MRGMTEWTASPGNLTRRGLTLAGVVAVLLMLTGCGSTPERTDWMSWAFPPAKPTEPAPANACANSTVVAAAQSVLGLPYRWGGESPDEGFDCSGLVRYAYQQVGVLLPRTAADQYHWLAAVSTEELAPGDLVFFAPPQTHGLHVGIYVGHERFLHAPSRGKRIGYAHLANPYWKSCFIGGRRLRERMVHS